MYSGRIHCLLLLFAAQIIAADPVVKTTPTPEQGTISPSGKFTPAYPAAPSNENVPRTQADAEEVVKHMATLKQTGANTFQIGQVEFDKEKRTVTFPATICLRDQVIEYALVTTHGKTYESLLSTEVSPVDIHLAMLLLNVGGVPVLGDFKQPAPVPDTNAVRIEISWKTNGQTITIPLATLVCLTNGHLNDPGRPMTLDQWLYNGSEFNPWGFAVLREGSLIAMIRDSTALINNPGTDRDNDQIHFPNTNILPSVGTSVQVMLRLTGPKPVPPPSPWSGVTPITPLSTNQYPKP
jgi:hypothetical protein